LRIPPGTLRPQFLRGLVLFFFFAHCPYAAAQEPLPLGEVAVASAAAAAAPAAPSQQSNLMLNLSKNSEYSRVGLDYSVRWDFSDLLSFRPGLKTITSGVKAITSWDITKNTRLNYYGFRTNPWRVILADEPRASAYEAAAATAPAGGGVVNRPARSSGKRLRLSVSPLVDDFKLNFDEGLRELLLRSSLKGLSPQWERVGKEGRREFVRDVLSLGIWDAPLPGVAQGREGLEYLSAGPGAANGAGVYRSTVAPDTELFVIKASTGR